MNSKNKMAEEVLGLRNTKEGQVIIDLPCELGYHCPVCVYDNIVRGNYNERLHWSEYNGMIRCEVCNKDYLSAQCILNDIDRQQEVFMETILYLHKT